MKAGVLSRRADWSSAWFEVKDYPSGSRAQRRRRAVIARTAKRGERAESRRKIRDEY